MGLLISIGVLLQRRPECSGRSPTPSSATPGISAGFVDGEPAAGFFKGQVSCGGCHLPGTPCVGPTWASWWTPWQPMWKLPYCTSEAVAVCTNSAQMKYFAFDREMFACHAGIRYFHFILESRPFTVFTNHKPLTYAVARTSDPWTAQQCR